MNISSRSETMTLEQVRDSLMAVYARDCDGTSGDQYRAAWAKKCADAIDAYLCAERREREGYRLVPTDIHPLERTDCDGVIELLRTPPIPTNSEDEIDYYAHWWQKLLAAAPDGEAR